MKAIVIVFPGSNCDRDMAVALRRAGFAVEKVWHAQADLPSRTDLVAIPGGFSFGDYLRCGAIAARSRICAAIGAHAARGGFVLGVCNGFQVLTEMGLLPGALMRNSGLKFVCRSVELEVASSQSPFTGSYTAGEAISIPIAHHDGNYQADPEAMEALRQEDRIAFRYRANPNGSAENIAGILSKNRRVLGMMPHPERAIDQGHGGTDGQALFRSLLAQRACA